MIVNRIFNKIKSVFYTYKNNKRVKFIQRSTDDLVKHKKSDIERWKHNSELHSNWNARTEILASFISENAKVIEFGAGNMHMKTIINPENYTPSDIVKRFDETIVCDLNQDIQINLKPYHTAVFSGVLEYVYNIDLVFAQLEKNKVNQIVMSYCCTDIISLSRAKNGWLSSLSKNDLLQIFEKYSYQLEDYKEWNNQSIFNLKRV